MKKVLLLAAAVLTLGTATAHLGLNGTFGKPVSKAIHKVVESVKINMADASEMKAGKAVAATYTDDVKALKVAKPMVNGLATPMAQMFTAEKLTVSPAKAAIAKQLAAKAPAAMSQTYTGNCQYYSGGKWNVAQPWTMTTASVSGADYMFNVIPDLAGFGSQISAYANGVFVQYTSTDNGDGTTAISIAPQYIASTADYDIFLVDRSSANHGGDGSIKMTLAADGKLTVDNPTNVVGYFATPINKETPEDEDPSFVAANVAGAFEQTGLIEYSIPVPDTFVAETTYTGKGTDVTYDSEKKKIETPVTWEMKMGKKDGVAVIRDLVPSVESTTGLPTDVEYTVEGDKIIIQPQKVGMFNSYYLYIFDWQNGAITLTKDQEGHIITPDDMMIYIGAYTTDEFDPSHTLVSNGGTYVGFLQNIEGPKYYAEGQEIPDPAPVATYEPASTILNVAFSTNGSAYTNATFSFVPGYAEIPYVNTTSKVDEATTWSWVVCDSIYDANARKYNPGTAITSTEKDFSFFTKNRAIYGQPALTATNGNQSATYVIGGGNRNYMTVGDMISNYSDSESGDFHASLASTVNGFAAYSDFGTSDYENNQGTTTFALYQGKPAAPLYIEGLNLMVYGFTQNADFTLTARIVEATRNARGITLGKTIAYADASEYTAIDGTKYGFLYFNDMYVLDEDEMSESIEHLFIDKEFAVVIDGWNNGTFSAIPVVERNNYNENGQPNIFFDYSDYSGYTNFIGDCTHMYVGFNEAAYGFLHTADNTNFTVLATGGEEKIRIDEAMLSSVDANDVASPRVFVSDNCPEWVTVDVENANEDGTAFDLKFTFDKNDGEARKATFYVWQEGAKIDVTVDQAGTINTGISGITAEGTANGPRYNVAGQRVNASAKGIVISNGKKQIAK